MCWFRTEKGVEKMSACISFLKDCSMELKGPVDLFKGFQQVPEEPFQLRIWNNPKIGRSQNSAEGWGGLHHLLGASRLVIRVLQLHKAIYTQL